MARRAIITGLVMTALLFASIGISALPTARAAAVCTDPDLVFEGQGSRGLGDYYADANLWNAGGYDITQTMGVCGHDSWYVDVSAADHQDGAVLSYPNMHRDYHDWMTGAEPKISSLPALRSTFAHDAPSGGIWNVGYDLWLNGVADDDSTELMIWAQNSGQTPAGSKQDTVSISGHSWDLWASRDNRYLAFVATKAVTSDTLDLEAFMRYLMDDHRLATTSTLGQVDYGVEIVSTGGAEKHFDFTDFSVTTTPGAGSSAAQPAASTSVASAEPSSASARAAGSTRPVIAAGSVDVDPVAGTPTSEHVTFPEGRFSRPPVVTTTAVSRFPGRMVETSVTNVTRTGCDVVLYRTTDVTTQVGWTAVQP